MSRSRSIVLSITLASGCEFGLDPVGPPVDLPESIDSSGPCAGQGICIGSLSPDEGPTRGGTMVSVFGGGFDADAVVRFGAAELATTVVSDTELRVTTLAAAVETSVDVTVVSGGETVTAVDAFTYTNTPTTDDTGGGGPDNTGLVSGLVESSYLVVGCPACFSLTDYLSYEVGAIFHSPVRGSWLDAIPSMGSCLVNTPMTQLSSSGLDVGDWVYYNTSGQSLSLRRITSGGLLRYSSGTLESTDYVRGASYDISVSDGGAGGAFELTGVVRTPSGFDDVQPIEILNDDPRAFSARISASRASFTWSPTDVADGMVVDVAVYNPNGTALLGEVVCQTRDNGSFQMPSSYLSGYPANSLLAIQIYRLNLAGATDPRDNSTVEGIASFGVLGTATLSP